LILDPLPMCWICKITCNHLSDPLILGTNSVDS
jgi:hypothetical protein